ncbi:MAG: polyprenyl synthetase family protein [bacterium]|nr:polyprenyl synthetase family protein [bacterium]
MKSLQEIIHPVDEDIVKVKEVFYDLLQSDVKIINIIAKHYVRQKGKWFRPVLVLLSGRLCGELTPESYKAAALIEMLHNATLIHDDVVDDATVRRGGPSLNSIWKNKIPVLMGDYILARSLTTASELASLKAIEVLSNTSARMSQGEISQLVKSRKKDLSEEEYFQIISDKTAALISACCQLGGITVTPEQEKIEALSRFGEKLGEAFQIKDDLLDFQGEEKIFGKSKGTDIKNGKITLPLIYALRQVDRSTKSKVIRRVKKKASHSDVKFVIQFIYDNGGVEYSQQKAGEIITEAKKELEIFPDSVFKNALIELSEYVINRNK